MVTFMNYDTYHIPTNFTDAGRILGLFELRNIIEAVLMVIPALYICIAWLPLGLTAKVIVTMIIVVPTGGFGLMGINDDSFSRWFSCWWRWCRHRRVMFFRGEVK